MKRRARIYYTEADKALMWDLWQQGETLHAIARLFDRYHNSIRRILTDNGACYKSKLWHRTSETLGVRVKKTRPYRPQTNGKAERFIQTLMREWAYFRAYETSNERMAVLPI